MAAKNQKSTELECGASPAMQLQELQCAPQCVCEGGHGVLTVASGAFRLKWALLSWLISEGKSAFSEHGT